MYVLPNKKIPSCNHCCSKKLINIKYSKCVFVVLDIQFAMLTSHTANCGLSDSIIFFHIIS